MNRSRRTTRTRSLHRRRKPRRRRGQRYPPVSPHTRGATYPLLEESEITAGHKIHEAGQTKEAK